MGTLEIISGSLLILSSILIVIAVVLQKPKGSGLSGAIMGGSDSGFGGRSKAKSNEEKLSKLTKILASVFFVVTFIVNLIVLSK